MNTLYLAKDGNGRIIAATVASDEDKAHIALLESMSDVLAEQWESVVNTGLLEDSPEAKLLIAIFGDDES